MVNLDVMLHGIVLTVGVVLIVFGMWGSTRLRSPYDGLVAWCAPVGLLTTLVGIILLIIPDFFT